MEKNGTPASPATAFASSVFPVPGGPTSRTPFGMRAPSAVYTRGLRRKSTISCSSSFSSSAPATSANVTLDSFPTCICGLLLPNCIALPDPALARKNMNISAPKIRISRIKGRKVISHEASSALRYWISNVRSATEIWLTSFPFFSACIWRTVRRKSSPIVVSKS